VKLNKIERLKEELLPFDYSLDSVDFVNLEESDRFYLKNFGIYSIHINSTAFMIRLRFDAGVITKEQLEPIYSLLKEYNLDILLTARAQIELHGLVALL